MLFAFDKQQSDRLGAKVFDLFRLAREQVFCKSPSESTFLDLAILSFVSAKKSPAMKDVATALRVSPPAATNVIGKLMEKKYIARIEDRDDRRIVRLSITEKGKKEIADGMDKALASMEGLLSVLDHKEQKEFEKLITKILNNHA